MLSIRGSVLALFRIASSVSAPEAPVPDFSAPETPFPDVINGTICL